MSLPVDLEDLARKLNIILIPYDFPPSISGMAYVGRRKFVLYNVNHPLPRRRFTIAHEIYHIEKHMRDNRKPFKRAEIEIEANIGAARILLPCKDLKEHLRDPQWLYDLTALAKKAIVSPVTLVRRIADSRLLNISLYHIHLNKKTVHLTRLAGDPVPPPGRHALLEGARGREFFLRRNGYLYRFSKYGKTSLLYVYPL